MSALERVSQMIDGVPDSVVVHLDEPEGMTETTMTAPDLAAVCRAHGITLGTSPQNDAVTVVADGTHTVSDYSAEWAVCFLLKARYNIGTQRRSGSQTIDGRTEYTASASGSGSWKTYPTELAAVLALADRLKDGAS